MSGAPNTKPDLAPRELDMILAALRHWQASKMISSRAILEIAEQHGEKLSDEEIDQLCERLNLGGKGPKRTPCTLEGMDQQCRVGQTGMLYWNDNNHTVTTFDGEAVTATTVPSQEKGFREFWRKGRLFRFQLPVLDIVAVEVKRTQ